MARNTSETVSTSGPDHMNSGDHKGQFPDQTNTKTMIHTSCKSILFQSKRGDVMQLYFFVFSHCQFSIHIQLDSKCKSVKHNCIT